MWIMSHRNDSRAARIADRHYSRVTVGSRWFVRPAKSLVLVTANYDALWVSLWPIPEYNRIKLNNSFQCSLFRNESSNLSSSMILDAMRITESQWGPPPRDGWVTFVDPRRVRHKRDPGRCFRKAGYFHAYTTKKGLMVMQCTLNCVRYLSLV